ncbi:hypothetical protein BDN70DRAFT_872782 [Pholiota conissans]|uniref:Uncharacterized protein n=1 Tax=Pholiota conissans TaxID=109636 RepID=A0A9P5Z9W8_9AGAR|nr:hypothetical protein BDN70DRAFT_872782 [Pholiota conissans]
MLADYMENIGYIQTFQRDVVDSDWERFDIYAKHVRKIGYRSHRASSMKSIAIDDKILRQLETRGNSRILLPRLKVVLAEPGKNSIPATLLLSDSVRSVFLKPSPDFMEDILQFLHAMTRAHSIKSLAFDETDEDWQPEQFAEITRALEILMKNVDLEEFSCEWLPLSGDDNSMMGSLMQMRNLQKLSIFMELPKLKATLETSTISESKMTNLAIWTGSDGFSDLPDILANLQPAGLQTFEIHPPWGAPYTFLNREEVQSLMSALEEHCSARALTIVDIEIVPDYPPPRINPSGAIIEYGMIRPLFSFSNIRELCLADHTMDLTDEEIKELAMSWPRLEALFLSLYCPPGFRPRATLKCLLWLAIYCKHLSQMKFVFDATRHVADSDLEIVSRAVEARTKLEMFDVGDSSIDKPDQVAAFFSRIFPNLAPQDLHWSDDDGFDEECQDMWENVTSMMEGRSPICEDEQEMSEDGSTTYEDVLADVADAIRGGSTMYEEGSSASEDSE